MTTFSIFVSGHDFYSFRRWLKARDPEATVTAEQADDDLWRVRAQISKFYLDRMAARLWAAP